MPVTMVIGAFIGGATSEGGGAVAFPVMTLALALEPRVARDFVYVSQWTGEFQFVRVFCAFLVLGYSRLCWALPDYV
jgi:hypothetical protein